MINLFVINPIRIFITGAVVLVTVVFCTAPHFHPEGFLGWRYHWMVVALFHGGYYFVATLLLYIMLREQLGIPALYLALLALSVVLECLQGWVPGRSLSDLDLISNAAGITAAAVLAYKLRSRKPLPR